MNNSHQNSHKVFFLYFLALAVEMKPMTVVYKQFCLKTKGSLLWSVCVLYRPSIISQNNYRHHALCMY